MGLSLRMLVASSLIILFSSPVLAKEIKDPFSIRTMNFDGTNIKTVYSDTFRQATHLRVSPDGQWIMFSRYNEKDPGDGLAKENWGGRNHYENTELMIMRSNGSELRTLIPPQEGILAVNSNWTQDGKGFVYLSTNNEKRIPEIRRVTLSSTMEVSHSTTIAIPEYLIPLDPHLYQGKLVFPAVDLRNSSRGLWISSGEGSELRQLTTPKHPVTGKAIRHPASGDNDPRISPDGSTVTFMRLVEGHALWRVFVVDIASGIERNLSGSYLSPKQMDAVPEWSGDGKRLIFWTVDIKKITFDITSVRPDGTDRVTLLSDPDIFQQSPAFFPNSGSDQSARIAYSTQTVPGWKLRIARFLGRFK